MRSQLEQLKFVHINTKYQMRITLKSASEDCDKKTFRDRVYATMGLCEGQTPFRGATTEKSCFIKNKTPGQEAGIFINRDAIEEIDRALQWGYRQFSSKVAFILLREELKMYFKETRLDYKYNLWVPAIHHVENPGFFDGHFLRLVTGKYDEPLKETLDKIIEEKKAEETSEETQIVSK